MSILSIQNLNKSFGEHKIINNLTFSVPEGTIYGFLGQNGSGKTTTMKMVLGLLKPNSGSISVCGETVSYGETKTNRHIGFLPDVPEFYGYMKPAEYLSLCGKITGLDRKRTKEKSEELLSLVGLDQANKRIGGFSRGMKQRLGIAQALLNEPKLLICDEPTSALDPIGRKEILDILLSVKGKTTIVFSTHILSDVERICDHAAVLHNGSIVLNGTLTDLKQSRRHDTILIEFASTADLDRFFGNESVRESCRNFERKERTVTIQSDNIAKVQGQIYDAFSTLKIYPERVEILEPTLESLFMEVVK
ncbi:ABC transporter ATP-binding protein [Bacillus massilinigeriensis]|uniref:ABC transporter ATP-binding protein n=1 Tax=Bacillus mediterraneensis TaxID=1805474 RepID=UPI0008F87005|nr:ABC transporter ATP-binding protein [Bacillus mediterraneensis]